MITNSTSERRSMRKASNKSASPFRWLMAPAKSTRSLPSLDFADVTSSANDGGEPKGATTHRFFARISPGSDPALRPAEPRTTHCSSAEPHEFPPRMKPHPAGINRTAAPQQLLPEPARKGTKHSASAAKMQRGVELKGLNPRRLERSDQRV